MSGVLVVTVSILVIISIIVIERIISLKRASKLLIDKINHNSFYDIASLNNDTQKSIDSIADDNNKASVIAQSLESRFPKRYITFASGNDFKRYYAIYYRAAKHLVSKQRVLGIKPSKAISVFLEDFDNINACIRIHNESIISNLLETYKSFFDSCLKYPLDAQQRRAIVSEEDNCLVVSSAGSGKTSSIVGKVRYLIDIKGIDPGRILLISYTNKAASELTERIGIESLRGYTFHKLALDIIGRVTGKKPSICDNADAVLMKIFREMIVNPQFSGAIIKYFSDYQLDETNLEKKKFEKLQQLSEQKNMRLKALLPDMDGKIIYVRSEQERKICFILSSLGVKFRYEEPYEHPVADAYYSQYRPDFSIHFEQNGEQHRIYLEHFGINEQGLVPAWFAVENNISYAEACQKYNDGITWKKAIHKKFRTKLIATTSADFDQFDIKEKIKQMLLNAGVPLHEQTNSELYKMILPEGSKQEKVFIRLIITFITLLKSNCKSLNEVLKLVRKAGDQRSEFVIKNIFSPIYERYNEELNHNGQIDFTDAILWATELCRSSHMFSYDYIIIDEFQDISIDRYKFLIALRDGSPPSKLYCVGDDWQSIYRFSGSDMTLFNDFASFFGQTEINKIETTYRFGEPLVGMSSRFIQVNTSQIPKKIHPFSQNVKTDLSFKPYGKDDYFDIVSRLVATIPADKSVFLLGRYSFDDYYLSHRCKSIKEGNRFYYIINNRKIEFLTVHKSKGLEADYVILLQCNKDVYGFPSNMCDDRTLQYLLAARESCPYAEERRLFYVAITRAKIMTWVLYNIHFPSVFVEEFLYPERVRGTNSSVLRPNANKPWTRSADKFLLTLNREGKGIRDIAEKMGRSQASIIMRLRKLESMSKIKSRY